MADKREKCKGLQRSLSDALGKDLSHSEISGSRVTELDSLGDFYVAFTKELTTTINPALNQNCKEIDYTILKASSVALGELCTKYKKLKLLASFDNCLQLSTLLEKTSIFIAGVNEWEIETELIYEVASDAIQREGDLATLGGPTVQAIVNMIKTCQEVPDRIIRAGVSVSKLKKLSVTSEDLLSSPVLNFMSNSKPLEELCDAIVEALRDAPEAHPANDLLNKKIRPSCNFIKSVSRAIKIHETIISAVGTKDPLSVLGGTQGSLFVTASCSLCRIRESIAKDSLITCINSFKADEMCDIFINIENELTLTCSNERARVKQLNKFTDADILEYRFAGTLIEAVVVKKYIPMLVPHWSNLVISHQLGLPPQVTGIVCTFGEVLKLSNPIEATLTLSEGIPLIIQEQASTIEAMTHAALDLAHNIAIGRVKFDVKAMMVFPTQVALRMVLFLWTELVEGSIFTTMKRSSGPHKDTSDTSSLNCLDTISGNVNQDEFIHFGTNSRKSVSLTFQSSRKTSPRKNFIDYPSPGSASSPWLRKAKKTVDSTANSHKGDNVEIERIGASDSDSSHRHRTSSVRSRATIRDSLPYQAAYTIAANLPQRAATTSAVAKQIRTPKSKNQSTFTTHARLSDILNVILSQMRQYLLSNQLSLSDTTKLRVLIMWMYRMLRTWEQDVSHAATAEDYLWLREPRLYRKNSDRKIYFEQGTSSYHVKHFFLPINPKFVLTAPYLNVWSHLSTCDALSKAALIRGDALDAISTFAAISGISLDVLDARSKKLIILPKPVRNIILHAEKLSLDDQTSLCNLLKDTTDTSVSILTENIEKLHPILLSLPVPHIIIEENMQFIIECYIASSGCDDAPSLAKSISYFSKICESIGQWAIPLPLIHQAVNTLTPLMKVGLSSDAALYESIQNVILPRAPFSCISAINLAKSTLFPYRSAHIHFPRLTTCIKQTCEEMNICWSEDLDTKVMEIFKFLTGKAAHAYNASVLVIRGEGVCGKTTLRDIALRAYNLLMGYSPRVSTVSPIHAEDNIRQIVDEDVDNHQSKRDRAGESSPVKLSRVILLDSLPKYKNIIRKNKNDSCFDNNAEISNREDILFSKWLSLTGLLDLPPSMEGSVILIIETSLDTLPMDVVCCGNDTPKAANSLGMIYISCSELEMWKLHWKKLVASRVLGSPAYDDPKVVMAQSLIEEHISQCIKLAMTCSGLTSCGQVLATFFTLFSGILRQVNSSNLSEDTISKCFWFAATWSCATDCNHSWVEFVVSRIPASISPQPDIFSCFIGSCGHWIPWTRTPSSAELPEEISPFSTIRRASMLRGLLLSGGRDVCLAGPAVSAFSRSSVKVSLYLPCAEPSALESCVNSDKSLYIDNIMPGSFSASEFTAVLSTNKGKLTIALPGDSAGYENPVNQFGRLSMVFVADTVILEDLDGISTLNPLLKNVLVRVLTCPLGSILSINTVLLAHDIVSRLANPSAEQISQVCMMILSPICTVEQTELLKGVIAAANQVLWTPGTALGYDKGSGKIHAVELNAAQEKLYAAKCGAFGGENMPTLSEAALAENITCYLSRVKRAHCLIQVLHGATQHISTGIFEAVVNRLKCTVTPPISSFTEAEKLLHQESSQSKVLHIAIRYTPAQGEYASTDGRWDSLLSNIVSAVHLKVILDLSYAEVDRDFLIRCKRVIPFGVLSFEEDDIYCLLPGDLDEETATVVTTTHLASRAFDKSSAELRLALKLFQNINIDVHTEDDSCIKMVSKCIKACKEVEMRAARETFISAAEQNLLDFEREKFLRRNEEGLAQEEDENTKENKTPVDFFEEVRQELLAFEGSIEYNDYPTEPLRLLMNIKMTEKSETDNDVPQKVKECSHVCIFAGLSANNIVQLSTAFGGACKSRLEGNIHSAAQTIIITANPIELRLTFDTNVLSGTISDISRGNPQALGRVSATLGGTASMIWLRTGNADEATFFTNDDSQIDPVVEAAEENQDTEESVPRDDNASIPGLASARGLGINNDTFEKLLSSTVSTSKLIQKALVTYLKTLCAKSRSSLDLAMSVSLLPRLASVDYDERQSILGAARAAYQESSGRDMGDPLTMSIFSMVLEEMPKQTTLWVATQRKLGLPEGPNAEQVVLFVKLLIHLKVSTVVIYDHHGLFEEWALNKSGDIHPICVLSEEEFNSKQSTRAEVSSHTEVYYYYPRNQPDKNRIEIPISMVRQAMLVNACQTVQSLASVLNPSLATSTAQDINNIARAAEVEKECSAAVKKVLKEGSLIEKNADFFTFLSTQDANECASKMAILTDAPGSAATTSSPSNKPSKSISSKKVTTEDSSLRVAKLALETYRLLPTIRPIYDFQFSSILTMAKACLKAPSNGSQGQNNASSKVFANALLKTVLQEDRLILCVGLAMSILIFEEQVQPVNFTNVLKYLRTIPPNPGNENDAILREEAESLFNEWKLKKSKEKTPTKGPKKTVQKELKDFLSPDITPEYEFMTNRCWAGILYLSRTMLTLKDLPAALQHGDLSKGVRKEEKWEEWLTTCIGPVPTFDKKGSTLGSLEKLMVILTMRPSKLTVGLLQFVVETFGTEFPDPYAFVNPVTEIISLVKQVMHLGGPVLSPKEQAAQASDPVPTVSTSLVLIVPELASNESIQQIVVTASGQLSTDKDFVKSHKIAPSVNVKNACYIDDILETIDRVFQTNDWVLIEGSEYAPENNLKLILEKAKSAPVSFQGLIIYVVGNTCGEPVEVNLNNNPTLKYLISSTQRIGCSFVWSLRNTMNQHYISLNSECLQELPTKVYHRLTYMATFLVSAIEQRSRFSTLGFSDPAAFRRCERDAANAASAVLSFVNNKKVPWDAIRQTLMNIIGGLAKTTIDRAVIRAYIDWLVHPSTISPKNEYDEEAEIGIPLPNETTIESHFTAISALPAIDTTELIGLHSGVERSQREEEVERIFNFLESYFASKDLDCARQCASDVLKSIPMWSHISIANTVLGTSITLSDEKQYPVSKSRHCAYIGLQHDEFEGSTGTCNIIPFALKIALYKEVKEFHRVLNIIRGDLKAVQERSEMCDVGMALSAQKVPKAWRDITETSITQLPEWIVYLQNRHNQLLQWSREGGKVPTIMVANTLAFPKLLVASFVHDAAIMEKIPFYEALPDFGLASKTSESHMNSNTLKCNGVLSFAGLRLIGAQIDNKGMIMELSEDTSKWWKEPNDEMILVTLTVQRDPIATAISTKRIECGKSIMIPRPPTAARKISTPISQLDVLQPNQAVHEKLATSRPGTSHFDSRNRSRPHTALGALIRPDHVYRRHTHDDKKVKIFYAPLIRYTGSNISSSAQDSHNESFFGEVPIPCFEDHNYWMLRGATLIAN